MGDIEILKDCLSKVETSNPFICLEFQIKTFLVNEQVSNIDMSTDVFPGEGHGEAGVLPGDPQGGN